MAARSLLLSLVLWAAPHVVWALPEGYFVWSKGRVDDMASRKCYRMTFPRRDDVKALTPGEDISCTVSLSGRWLAYAKARLAGGTSYGRVNLWDVYVVHIDGVEAGHAEVKVDAGYWPSWGQGDVLYYNQPDGAHTRIYRVEIDGRGQPNGKRLHIATRTAYETMTEVNQCSVSPDGRWFAGRTRGQVDGVGAFIVTPPQPFFLGKAGSVGCMPYVAPDGSWGLLAGTNMGIRWGEAPDVPNRQTDLQLIPPKGKGWRCYHPGIATDGRWVVTGHSQSSDVNVGPWDLYVYNLDPATKAISDEVKLTDGGFNGWPHIWVRPETVLEPEPGDPGCAVADRPAAEPGLALWLLLLTPVWAFFRGGRR